MVLALNIFQEHLNIYINSNLGPIARRANVQIWQFWDVHHQTGFFFFSISVIKANVIRALGTLHVQGFEIQFTENHVSQCMTDWLTQITAFWICGNGKLQVDHFYYSGFSLKSIYHFQYTGIQLERMLMWITKLLSKEFKSIFYF